ncbi:MAG: hypothetical protein AABW50_00580 [Nanoarchaeota archaeon]
MEDTKKGGLFGFLFIFVGLWIFLLLTGNSEKGWECTKLVVSTYCTFDEFFFSIVNWGFVLFFSVVSYFAGVIDIKIIQRIIKNNKLNYSQKALKITFTLILTLIVVIGIIGTLAFDNWVGVMIYVIIFSIFAMVVAWVVGKIKGY